MQEASTTLKVTSILEPMVAVLSERARAVFANVRSDMAPNLFYFGCLYAATDDPATKLANYHDFAHRVNYIVEQLNGRSRMVPVYNQGELPNANSLRLLTHALNPHIDACITPPMEVPLAGERIMLLAYVFIQDVPDGKAGKAWVNSIVGDHLRCALEGELPENPPGLPTPLEPSPHRWDVSISGRIPND